MDILLIFLGIISIIVIVVMIKYFTDPKVRKAANILNEYHEKEKNGELVFSEKVGYMDTKEMNIEDDDNITSDDFEDILLDLGDYSEFSDRIELPICGINFRNLSDENIGTFDGYLMADKNNEYDEYAIGIYDKDGVHFGFVEKAQKYFYNKIEEKGGMVNGIIEVRKRKTGKNPFHGTVTIDKHLLL